MTADANGARCGLHADLYFPARGPIVTWTERQERLSSSRSCASSLRRFLSSVCL